MNKKFYKYVNKKIFKILLNTIILVNIIIGMLLLLLLQTQPAIIEGKKKDDKRRGQYKATSKRLFGVFFA